MNLNEVYKIRDGVDLYLSDNELLTIYFMNTRVRKQFRVSSMIVDILESLDGEKTIKEIFELLVQKYNKSIDLDAFLNILKKFYDINLVVKKEVVHSQDDRLLIERYDRQVNFFTDFLIGEGKSIEAQQKLRESKILIFGCGAIGGDIAIQLAMCGVENFILYDYDIIEESDVTRHLYYKRSYLGLKKVDALADYLKSINSDIIVETINHQLIPQSDVTVLIDKASFVINTADEPYIGYTSMKISRYCTKMNKAHFIGGGFDAHLASSGELIIPGITPCVDCYAGHFKKVLSGWKPEKHPVVERYLEIGGLSSLSLFSASYATVEIIKYICGLIEPKEYKNTRGEFLFDNMKITYLDVVKDKNCQICGEIVYE